MRVLEIALLPIILLAGAAPAEASNYAPNAGMPHSCTGRQLPNVGTVYFPPIAMPDPEAMAARPRRVVLAIGPSGKLRLGGVPISREVLGSRLAAQQRKGNVTFAIQPAQQTPAEAVAFVLRTLNQGGSCNFTLDSGQPIPGVFNRKELEPGRLDIPPLAPFAIFTDALVHVDHRPPSAAPARGRVRETGCRAYLNATETNSHALFTKLSERVKNLVTVWWNVDDARRSELFPPALYGGNEISAEQARETSTLPPDIFLNTAIYTKGATPWMCVAGAVSAAQFSAMARADLIVTDQP